MSKTPLLSVTAGLKTKSWMFGFYGRVFFLLEKGRPSWTKKLSEGWFL